MNNSDLIYRFSKRYTFYGTVKACNVLAKAINQILEHYYSDAVFEGTICVSHYEKRVTVEINYDDENFTSYPDWLKSMEKFVAFCRETLEKELLV